MGAQLNSSHRTHQDLVPKNSNIARLEQLEDHLAQPRSDRSNSSHLEAYFSEINYQSFVTHQLKTSKKPEKLNSLKNGNSAPRMGSRALNLARERRLEEVRRTKEAVQA